MFKVLKNQYVAGRNELIHRTQDVLSTEYSQTLTHQTCGTKETGSEGEG